MENNNTQFQIGIKKINEVFHQIKNTLYQIAVTENLIENGSQKLEALGSYNTFEELEIMLNVEVHQFNKSKSALNYLKYMLILFEMFSGYLAVGVVTHHVPFDQYLSSEMVFFIKSCIAAILSFVFIHVAVKHVKDYPFIAYIFVPLFPAINLFTVYFTNLEIDNKETYIISSFVTLVAGTGLMLLTFRLLKQEKNTKILEQIKDNLSKRESLLDSAKKLYLKISSLSTDDYGFINDPDAIPANSTIYQDLRHFLLNCQDFDTYCFDRVDYYKANLRTRVLHKNISPATPIPSSEKIEVTHRIVETSKAYKS